MKGFALGRTTTSGRDGEEGKRGEGAAQSKLKLQGRPIERRCGGGAATKTRAVLCLCDRARFLISSSAFFVRTLHCAKRACLPKTNGLWIAFYPTITNICRLTLSGKMWQGMFCTLTSFSERKKEGEVITNVNTEAECRSLPSPNTEITVNEREGGTGDGRDGGTGTD